MEYYMAFEKLSVVDKQNIFDKQNKIPTWEEVQLTWHPTVTCVGTHSVMSSSFFTPFLKTAYIDLEGRPSEHSYYKYVISVEHTNPFREWIAKRSKEALAQLLANSSHIDMAPDMFYNKAMNNVMFDDQPYLRFTRRLDAGPRPTVWNAQQVPVATGVFLKCDIKVHAWFTRTNQKWGVSLKLGDNIVVVR